MAGHPILSECEQYIQFMVNFGIKYKSHKSNNFSFNSYFGEGETLLVYENSGGLYGAIGCRHMCEGDDTFDWQMAWRVH